VNRCNRCGAELRYKTGKHDKACNRVPLPIELAAEYWAGTKISQLCQKYQSDSGFIKDRLELAGTITQGEQGKGGGRQRKHIEQGKGICKKCGILIFGEEEPMPATLSEAVHKTKNGLCGWCNQEGGQND